MPKPGDLGTSRLAMLVAGASVLHVAESMLPHPVPGVRVGLANVFTLVALVDLGPAAAMQLAVMRSLVSSMVLGTFLSPTFLLSFSGAVTSALVMVSGWYLASSRALLRPGLIGISVTGAVAHILTQLFVAWLLLVRSPGVLALWPWLLISAVAAGVLTGLVALAAVRRLDSPDVREDALPTPEAEPPYAHRYVAGSSFLHRMTPALKVSLVALVGLVAVLTTDLRVYAGLAVLLVAACLGARLNPVRMLAGSRAAILFCLGALALPVLFTNWGRVLFVFGPVRITLSGVMAGLVFAARVTLLFAATGLLALTTAPEAVAQGLSQLLVVLRPLGVKPQRLAGIVAQSWQAFPVLSREFGNLLSRGRARGSGLRTLVQLPGEAVAGLYRMAGQVRPFEAGR